MNIQEQKHTPEPWDVATGTKAIDETDRHLFIVNEAESDAENVGIAHITSMDKCTPRDRANAYRIVACVNACAGMEDPAAEIARMKAFTTNAVCAYCREVMPNAPEIILKHMETCALHPLRDFQKICEQNTKLTEALKMLMSATEKYAEFHGPSTDEGDAFNAEHAQIDDDLHAASILGLHAIAAAEGRAES